MHVGIVLRYVGIVILLNAVFMLISAGVSLFHNFDTGFYPLILSSLISTVVGTFPLIFVSKPTKISNKEGYSIVVGAWLVCCMTGMFPYLLWGGEFDFATAWFETVSGYTTTGATALKDVEALPNGLLFWRSCTHWLGGVGVVLLALVALPSMGNAKMTLSNLEISSLAKDNFKYRTQKIIQILVVVYLGITISETILLYIAGMDWFDAINHAFSTVATGGFSTKNMSIAYYNSIWIELIITFFMLLSGLHFGVIFATLSGYKNNIFHSEVSKFYIATFIFGTLAITLSIWHFDIYDNIFTALRYASFQAASIISTTGFATANTNLWTPLAICLLMVMTIQCACAGSTSGGMKSDRVLIAAKVVKAQILQQQHPNAIIRIKLNGIIQSMPSINFNMMFIFAYLALIFIGTALFTGTGLDIITSFSMTATCMGNVGPGFGAVGSMNNYADLSGFVKISSTLFMLLGRLEIFGLIQLFIIKWWK